MLKKFKNTQVNFLNFIISQINRVIIVNITIFFWDEKELGNVSYIISFITLSCFCSSIIELQICKSNSLNKNYLFYLLPLNITILWIYQFVFLNESLLILVLITLIQLIVNVNLIISSIYFSNNHFIKYRLNCIISELIEMVLIIYCLINFNNPLLSYLLSSLTKNIVLFVLSIRKLRSFNLLKLIKNSSYKFDGNSHYMDILGSICITSLLPITIVYYFDKYILGLFVFYRQFLLIGNMIFNSLYKGLWRDVLNENSNFNFLYKFRNILFILPFLISFISIYFINLNNIIIFIGSLIFFSIINWNRLNILIAGHIEKKNIMNIEIIFIFCFTIISQCFYNLSNFGFVLSISAIIALLIHIIITKNEIFIFKRNCLT